VSTVADETAKAGATPDAGLRLSATEQELLAAEVRAIARLHPDPATRERYARLAADVESGRVEPERVEALATVLEVGLQSGRIRKVYGPDGEMALGRIYQRTPRGAAAASDAATVTEALRALQGQTLDEVRVTALGPGAYSLLLDTRQCQITIRLDRSGVRVDSVSLGV
jgi:hypothetical protein